MSARNTRAAKAARRKDRARRNSERPAADPDGLVQIQSWDELTSTAGRGGTLPCGCDAHELLHSAQWHLNQGT